MTTVAHNEAPEQPAEPRSAVAKPTHAPPAPVGLRETVETAAVALVLALLFRTFCAESFVIPTGSMAPTLLGRHKDLVCAACGQPFQVNAAGEVDYERAAPSGLEVRAGTCPACRHTMSLTSDGVEPREHPSYNGDRILAVKYPLALTGPRRWDVTVFRSPDDARECYLKRLVGLPGETIRIWQGDLWMVAGGLTPADDGNSPAALAILCKPASKVLAMAQLVHDNDRQTQLPGAARWPNRWRPQGGRVETIGTSYVVAENDSEPAWLRYEHRLPTDDAWRRVKDPTAAASDVEAPQPLPQLVTDFAAYNTYRYHPERTRPEKSSNGPLGPNGTAPLGPNRTSAGVDHNPGYLSASKKLGLHWVGDLILECEVQSLDNSAGAQGAVWLELVKAGRRALCTFDRATGMVELSHPALSAPRRAKASIDLRQARHLRFAHVDHQLLLWVDDKLIELDAPATYDLSVDEIPTAADLAPAAVGVVGAGARVSHLRLLRDNYYIATAGPQDPLCDYAANERDSPAWRDADELLALWSEPARWAALPPRRHVDFSLASKEYFLLGDNSPESRDGRLWPQGHAVAADLLVGKAICVYWPHAWETGWSWQLPGRGVKFPCYPSFSRMRLIR